MYAGKTAELGVGLESAHDVGVGERGLHRGLDIQAVRLVKGRVEMAFHAAHQIGGQVGEHARALGLDHEFAKSRQRHAGRAALIDQRGDTGAHPAQIGLQAEAPGDVLKHMRVGVDHAGDDQLAAHIDPFTGGD
ncbi:MAG: hypothetical protein NTV19_02050 [Burkholderiales bacterium]|nr:hypothetical protein [Burkholderiales bacterium]